MKFISFNVIKLIPIVGLIAGMCWVAPAHALWVEPYAGYEIGDQESGNTSYDASGLNLGIKGGATVSSINLGVEYALANLTVEQTNGDDDIKTRDIGLYVGTELSSVRLWFVYWFDSEGNSDDSGDYEGDGGFKFGLGFKAFSQLSFNIEKTLRKWKELEGSKLTQKVEIDGVLVSLSLPFTF